MQKLLKVRWIHFTSIHSHCAEDYHNEKINDIPGVALTGETCTNDSTVEEIRRYAYYNFSGPAICYN